MIDERCIGPDVDRSRISPDAQIGGSSYITGRRTSIGPGAVIRNSRLHDAAVGEGAGVHDSIVVAQSDHPHSHKCDAAGRITVTAPDQPSVGKRSTVRGCTFIDSAIGEESFAADSWVGDSKVGDRCHLYDTKMIITNTASWVSVVGPTEVSEAWLGHHVRIIKRGYYEGVFSNNFHKLRFDPAAGRLRIVETIDLPHLSHYAVNTINSTNSGKLRPYGGQPMEGFGKCGGLWRGEWTLSHEQIELGPCCTVLPWTKVVGQSPAPHETDEDTVNDELMTYLMPFSMAGYGGDLTRGLVMPGELSTGIGPKQRKGAWVFTYAPGAVVHIVAQLRDALDDARKHIADTIVADALSTAVEMTKAMAHKNNVDLSQPAAKQRPGWPRWIGQTYALLVAHIEGKLWQFSDGEAVGWRQENGKWIHPNIGRLLAIAPDAIENQKFPHELFDFADPVPPTRIALRVGFPAGRDDAEASIDPAAKVAPDAWIGPGSIIGAGSVIESGAKVWNSTITGAKVGRGASVERSIIARGEVGADTIVRTCMMIDTELGAKSTAQCASMVASRLADETTVSAFGDILDTVCTRGTILGGAFHRVDISAYLMSMHMAGGCRHMKAVPIEVEVGGRKVAVPAIPMLGGGSLIRGTREKPVVMQCCFLGSNAIVEPGAYIGFGCFILGTLGPDAGLPPFTISTDENVAHHQIGGVLTAMPSTILTHFIPWTYNAAGPELGPAVAEMMKQAIRDGIAAVEAEQARRKDVGSGELGVGSNNSNPRPTPHSLRPASHVALGPRLSHYSDEQLAAGLATYKRWLDSGAWDIVYEGGELKFRSEKGHWIERGGSAFWKAK
ncbi:MAG: hypothetical protein ACE15C_06790 [Phycisphaerae bacterium]